MGCYRRGYLCSPKGTSVSLVLECIYCIPPSAPYTAFAHRFALPPYLYMIYSQQGNIERLCLNLKELLLISMGEPDTLARQWSNSQELYRVFFQQGTGKRHFGGCQPRLPLFTRRWEGLGILVSLKLVIELLNSSTSMSHTHCAKI